MAIKDGGEKVSLFLADIFHIVFRGKGVPPPVLPRIERVCFPCFCFALAWVGYHFRWPSSVGASTRAFHVKVVLLCFGDGHKRQAI